MDAHCQQLAIAADGVEWCPQLVTHAGEKFGLRLAGSERFLLRFLALLDVERDAKPGVDVAGLVAVGSAARNEPAVRRVFWPQLDLSPKTASLPAGGLPLFGDS